MLEQIKSISMLNKQETSFLIAVILISSFIFWSVRTIRLESDYAVQVKRSDSIFIPEKMSVKQFALQLKALNLIENTKEFVWACGLSGFKTVQQGHYLVTPGNYSVRSFIPKFGLGQQDLVKVTIPPGVSLSRLTDLLTEQLRFTKEEFLRFLENEAELEALGLTKATVLGRLFPETYYMYWTTTPKKLIQETNTAVMKLIESNQSDSGQKFTPDQIITLASIVQWEAGNDEEKPTIAGLYLNRLNRRWKLQADPTVNFAVGERRRLVYADYEVKHPYNTYQIKGLPPGPITNPDKSSIEAVLFPQKHRYMYMVATPQGVHDFSITYEEHQRKSQNWVKWLRKQYRIKAEEERRSRS